MKNAMSECGRGYEMIGGQVLEDGKTPDAKEGIYIGAEIPADDPQAGGFLQGPNMWPDLLEEQYRKPIVEYRERMLHLAETLVTILALGLPYGADIFENFMKDPVANLKLLHYPPNLPGNEQQLGVADRYVVNIGDLLDRWTNGQYRSTIHRVLDVGKTDRCSIPFFYHGNLSTSVKLLDGSDSADAITVEEHIGGKFRKSYKMDESQIPADELAQPIANSKPLGVESSNLHNVHYTPQVRQQLGIHHPHQKNPSKRPLQRRNLALYIPSSFSSTKPTNISTGNCNPRQPASHFIVKKEGPNKGKWFYTCQEPKETSCGFFLWDENAQGREMRAVIINTRSEPDNFWNRTPGSASNSKQTIGGFSSARKTAVTVDLTEEDTQEDEFGSGGLSDTELVEVAERVSVPPSTPRKAIKTSAVSTPGSKRKWENADENTNVLPTPSTNGTGDIFMTASSTRNRLSGGMWDGNERPPKFGLRSPSATPTPSRFRDAIEPSSNFDQSHSENYDITDSVLTLLKDQPIDEETKASLKQLLTRHALKISGIAKGRDITRVALKAKDGKIAELQQRITNLETEREMDKVVIRHFKSDMANSVASRGGKGRGRGG
ncbi:hypothetical protein G7Y89_g1178 [Cudoniella acicularis]|uniref:GRF-type domain-containing protein n=1 Tax=Cudoniella acicularis TaxID=354080 RepID=A0A8H4W792_9HELO|nr:hypothetical protein G7Y89_g1178 [Cudoniella acicularis]